MNTVGITDKDYQFKYVFFAIGVFSQIKDEKDLQIMIFYFYLHNVQTSLELGFVKWLKRRSKKEN